MIRVLLILSVAAPAQAEMHKRSRVQMGTLVEIGLWSTDSAAAETAIEAAFAEVDRIERLMSEWKPDTEISRVNRLAATAPVVVGRETFAVIERGLHFSRVSDGAFDITWAALHGVWDFGAQPPRLPDAARVRAAAALIGYRSVTLDRSARSVRFSRAGVALGLGGIAKGYAVDRAAALLAARGFGNGYVNAGGDVLTLGSKGGKAWRVGINHPRGRPGELLALVNLRGGALVTSGDYERFMMIEGKRYHHIIDPATGWPAQGLMSVSVLARAAVDADALATAAFVLGLVKGLDLLERTVRVEGVIVDERGVIHMTTNAGGQVDLQVDRVTP